MENISFNDLVITAVILLALLTAYNTFCTARKNRREEEALKNAPAADIKTLLASDKRRIEALEQDAADTHEGMMAICAGVQALLEHELHDGNSKQMEEASRNINNWLLKR